MARHREADVGAVGEVNRPCRWRDLTDERPVVAVVRAVCSNRIFVPDETLPVGRDRSARNLALALATVRCRALRLVTGVRAPLERGVVFRRLPNHRVFLVLRKRLANHQPGLGVSVGILELIDPDRDVEVAVDLLVVVVELIGVVPDVVSGPVDRNRRRCCRSLDCPRRQGDASRTDCPYERPSVLFRYMYEQFNGFSEDK